MSNTTTLSPKAASLPTPPTSTSSTSPAISAHANTSKPVRRIRQITHDAAKLGDAFILRLPGTIGTGLWNRVIKTNKPYGVEVVGDPWDVFRPKANHSLLRPYLRHHFTNVLKKQCVNATAAAYVTREYLQNRYPPGGWSTNYSSVMLQDEAYITDEQLTAKQAHLLTPRTENTPWMIINVGSMHQVYKRQDLLIELVARLRANGIPVSATLVGEGRYRPMYEAKAEELGASNWVHFTGGVNPGQDVRNRLDQADLFVLSSETEGLARVLMESGARGMPIISTDVGGCGEVVDPTEIIPPTI